MGDATFGDAGTGSLFNFSCANTYWTNWSGSYGMGGTGRIDAIAAHWGYHSGCSSGNGHNDLWDTGSPFNRLYYTTDFGPPVGHGTWNNVGLPAALQPNWQTNRSFYIGFWRPAANSNEFDVHGGSNWSAKSGDDGNISGGTLHPYNSAGTLGVYGTYFVTQLWVWRSGWVQVASYVNRSAAWKLLPGNGSDWVFRSGSWRPIDEYVGAGFEIPQRGLEILHCPVDRPGCAWCERAYLVESGEKAWFGSCDVSKLGIAWDRHGFYPADVVPESAFISVRRNSLQTEEEIERLWQAKASRDRLLDDGYDPRKVRELWASSVEGAMIDGSITQLATVPKKSFSSLMARISEPLSVGSVFATSERIPGCTSCG